MNVTSAQLRGARAMLGWTTARTRYGVENPSPNGR